MPPAVFFLFGVALVMFPDSFLIEFSLSVKNGPGILMVIAGDLCLYIDRRLYLGLW